MPTHKTLLILGATGHFGGRICRRIAAEPGIDLVVSSRSADAAQELAGELERRQPLARIHGASLDQTAADFETQLDELAPDIVLHTAGPYQGQDYRVANACIARGSHYVDLADGRDFVAGITRLDDAARSRDVLAVSGASTLPALSSAVIEHLRDRFGEIRGVEISIAPAHRTPRGIGTIAAVLSYCGRPFRVLERGAWVTRYGWQDLRLQRYPELGARLSAACDVPDLALLPAHLPAVRTVTFHAALAAPWEQLALWLMAWLSRAGLVSDWRPVAPAMRWVGDRLLAFGSDTGGMHVRLSGVGHDGAGLELAWHLTARENHGPEIPCTPALIIARKLIRDEMTLRGAHPCIGLISLPEFDAEIGGLAIDWAIVD